MIFVLATLLGFISHTPGALGVFDAAILLALPQYSREELLATLLVFRFIYYLIPFTLALCTMAARELWLASQRPKPQEPGSGGKFEPGPAELARVLLQRSVKSAHPRHAGAGTHISAKSFVLVVSAWLSPGPQCALLLLRPLPLF